MDLKTLQDQSRIWIDGLPAVQMYPEQCGEPAFDWLAQIRGLTALLQQRGEPVTIQDIMACSGDAFHFSHATKWELRTAHALPIDPLLEAARAYGYNARWTSPDWTPRLIKLPMSERQDITSKYLGRLWDEIRAGRPLLYGGAFGFCNSWRILAGFDLENEQVCFVGGEQPYNWTSLWDEKARELGFWDMQVRGAIRSDEFLGGWQANACFLLGEKTKEIPERDRIMKTLNLAVTLSTAPSQYTDWYGGVTYHFGQGALKQWAEDLLFLDPSNDLSKPRPDAPEIYNLNLIRYQVEQITFGRSAAANYCENAAQQLENPALLEAAAAYRQQVSIARDSLEIFLSGDLDSQQAWLDDSALRETGVNAIHRILVEEQQAINWIQKALVDQ